MTTPPPAVEVSGLRKSYGRVHAVRDVSFTVGYGEIVALLGPNGAGKTTTLEILEGFRTRDGGTAEVLGCDPGERHVLGQVVLEPVLVDGVGVAPADLHEGVAATRLGQGGDAGGQRPRRVGVAELVDVLHRPS